MAGMIDDAAEALRAGAPAFTRRNLFHTVRRARGAESTEAAFDAALRRRLSRGKLPGLLPEPSRPRKPAPGWDSGFPEAVLLVDRPVIRDLFLACGAGGLAVVCVDGTPAPVVAWLERGFQEGRRAPVVYLHDAATVVFPFTLPPLATLVAQREGGPVRYRDLGLPPLGTTARRFGDPNLPADEVILELEAIPPATLLRHAVETATRLARGE